jgi:hypothetical protein
MNAAEILTHVVRGLLVERGDRSQTFYNESLRRMHDPNRYHERSQPYYDPEAERYYFTQAAHANFLRQW